MTEQFDPSGGYSREQTRREMQRRLTEADIMPRPVEECIKNYILLCEQQERRAERREFSAITGTAYRTVLRLWPKN